MGGAHRDHKQMAAFLKRALTDAFRQVSDLKVGELLERRYERLQSYGRFTDTKADANNQRSTPRHAHTATTIPTPRLTPTPTATATGTATATPTTRPNPPRSRSVPAPPSTESPELVTLWSL